MKKQQTKMIEITSKHSDGFVIEIFQNYLILSELEDGLILGVSIEFKVSDVNQLINGLLDAKREWINEYE